MRIAVLPALLFSCSLPPHVVLTIEDPYGAAVDATQLAAGFAIENLKQVELDKAPQFPLQITLRSADIGEQEIIVEARSDNGTALARGSQTTRLKRAGAPSAVIVLFQVCEADEDCHDELFCDGTGFCRDGLCTYENEPCVSDFRCVAMTCNEAARVCDVTVDHGQCPTGSYCDPGAGCVVGPPCMPENLGTDCQDGFVCNGEERCISFHCVGGAPPDVDDGDVCTLDG